MGKIRIGVSACLLGEQVRYDGGHKRNRFLLDELAQHVRFVPICPEVGIGLGVPRQAMRLVRRAGEVRLVDGSGVDHTASMRRWAAAAAVELRERDLSGFVLKKGSPSCGLERVRLWDESGEGPARAGQGLFAAALQQAVPDLPLVEEGRLNDPGLREHFVDRVFGHARVRDFFASSWTPDDLVRFHAREKVALLAHHPGLARRLGGLVAAQGALSPAELARGYRGMHAEALARRATPGRQANALMHLAGHLKTSLGSAGRCELRDAIEDYRTGLAPIAVPLALLARHLRAAGAEWARSQMYLSPYPKTLGLRGVIAPSARGAWS